MKKSIVVIALALCPILHAQQPERNLSVAPAATADKNSTPALAKSQTSASTQVLLAALARVRDMEAAGTLTAEGKALYQADAVKRTGYQYCGQSQGFAERGELREAIRAASKALFLGISVGDEDLAAHAKRDLAMAYLFAGDLDRAQQYGEEAMKLYVKPDNRRAVRGWTYKILGDVASRRGEFEKAYSLYDKSIDEADEALRFYARAALASAYAAGNQAAQARKALEKADSFVGVLSPNLQRSARDGLLRIRGTLALKDGKFEEAIQLFEEALAAQAGKQEFAYEQFWALEGVGRAKAAGGDKAGALKAYMDAIAASEKVRARFRSEEFKTGLFGEMQEVFGRAVQLLEEAGQPELAWEISERGRARALLDLLRNRVKFVPGTAVPADNFGRPTKLEDISSRLKPGEVVVGYHVLPARTYVWAIRSGGTQSIAVELGLDALTRQVEEYRNALIHHRPAANETGGKLYDALVKPLSLGEGEAVAFIPHGALHYLPFQALWTGDKYLIQKHAVSYVPSGGTLVTLSVSRMAKSGKLFALGNPDLGDPALALPGAQREVEAIRALFPEAETYFQKEATRERLLQGVGQSRFVHVAAHASVDAVDPLYSKIYLAGANQTGAVEARDIYAMKLDGAALVALSACETGLGKVSKGDEIWGFTRSFLSAGAPSLLVSLWPVSDESTEKLMKRFYGELNRGNDARRALQSAQLEVMGDPRFASPYFWSAFNLVGDWR
jgi:CHAT domain-containing protein